MEVAWDESEQRWCFLAGLLLHCPRGREQPMSGQYPLPAMLALGPCSRVRVMLQGPRQIFSPRDRLLKGGGALRPVQF